MAVPQPTTSYEDCLARYNNHRGLFARQYDVVTPVMAEHVNDFISMPGLTRDAARAHAFDYVTRARDLTIYTAIMSVGLATIPEVDEDEMVHIDTPSHDEYMKDDGATSGQHPMIPSEFSGESAPP